MIKNRLLKHNRKKKHIGIFICLSLLAIFFLSTSLLYAEPSPTQSDVELTKNMEDILSLIDTADLEQFLNSLNENQKSAFGSGSIGEKIKSILSGEVKVEFSSFMSYILSVAGVNVLGYLPLIISILVIIIAFNLITSLKAKSTSDSVENIVHFASISLIIIMVLSQIVIIISSVSSLIKSMQTQMNIVFPIILTMMAATGAVSTSAVYQPAVAILSSGITEVISFLIIPLFILSTVFTIVGKVSEGVKLKKMSEFFSSASKWFLSIMFLVFGAFLSVQGITASVFDGVSVRTAKFAVSKYVPIIGGYLSEGLNLVMAGSVLVKNAVGMTAVILLFLTLIPTLLQIIIFNLSLSLTSAIAEPLGGEKISALLSDLAKNMSTLIAIVLGMAFLYFVFLVLVITTGNLVL